MVKLSEATSINYGRKAPTSTLFRGLGLGAGGGGTGITEDVWTQATSIPAQRGHGAIVSLDEKIHYIGGDTGQNGSKVSTHYVYDPSTDSWSTLAALPIAESDLSGTVLDGKIHVIERGNHWAYDPVANSWTTLATPALGRVQYPAVVTIDGSMYVYVYEDMKRYNADTNTWTNLTPSPTPIYAFAFGTDGTYLYVMGDGTPSTIHMRYDPVADSWETLAGIPIALGSPSGAFVNGIFYMTGGYVASTFDESQSTFAYDPASDSWEQLADIPVARDNAGGTLGVADNAAWHMGGWNSSAVATTEVYKYG